MECRWLRISSADVAALRRASRGVAVLPLGSIESHGPHLPLGCDSIVLEEVVSRVLAREVVAMLPILHYSYVGSARPLPGAIHVNSDLLMAQVEGLCDEVYRNGFAKVVLLHGHGGNVPLHAGFLKRIQERDKPYVVYSIPPYAGAAQAVYALAETQALGHACEIETSMLLAAAPDLARLDRVPARGFRTTPGPDIGAALTAVDFHAHYPEMAMGEPKKATREKGEKAIDLWVDDIVDILRKIKRDRFTPRVVREYARKVYRRLPEK